MGDDRKVYSRKVYRFFADRNVVFRNYLLSTDQKVRTAEHISTHLKFVLPRKSSVTVNIIGGGSGEAEIPIINELISSWGPDVNIEHVEPSKIMSKTFSKRLSEIGLSNKISLYKTVNTKYESPKYQPPQSDLILVINSIYFLDGWNKLNVINPLVKIYSSLNPSGIATIVLKSHDSQHCKLKGVGGGGKTTGEKVRQFLQRLDIPFYWDTINAQIDVSTLFKDGKFAPDKQGNMLLSFIYKGEWNNFDKSAKAKVSYLLSRMARKVDNKYLLDTKYDCIWIYKEPNRSDIPATNTVGKDTQRMSSILTQNLNLIENFPKKNITFVDLTPILRRGDLFATLTEFIANKYQNSKIDYVAAKDMQALLWAGAVAYKMGIGVIPMFRKDLPGDLV